VPKQNSFLKHKLTSYCYNNLPLQTNERLRNCSTMKRPEPHQDFEKTIQRVTKEDSEY